MTGFVIVVIGFTIGLVAVVIGFVNYLIVLVENVRKSNPPILGNEKSANGLYLLVEDDLLVIVLPKNSIANILFNCIIIYKITN